MYIFYLTQSRSNDQKVHGHEQSWLGGKDDRRHRTYWWGDSFYLVTQFIHPQTPHWFSGFVTFFSVKSQTCSFQTAASWKSNNFAFFFLSVSSPSHIQANTHLWHLILYGSLRLTLAQTGRITRVIKVNNRTTSDKEPSRESRLHVFSFWVFLCVCVCV